MLVILIELTYLVYTYKRQIGDFLPDDMSSAKWMWLFDGACTVTKIYFLENVLVNILFYVL